MKKRIVPWTVEKLRDNYTQISFPEYQREPNVWARGAKQRLIDSMARDFDISSLYFYIDDNDDSIQCVDGRQRIGAIMSFLGDNAGDDDNEFEYRINNEINVEENPEFDVLKGKKFRDIEQLAQEDESEAHDLAVRFVQKILNYEITIIHLESDQVGEEFNLQFTRLNLGTMINAGEKLNAMMGEIRDVCFGNEGLGKHPFWDQINLPKRRFARQQIAAQVLSQVFAWETDQKDRGKEFTRARYVDLQALFKEYSVLQDNERTIIQRVTDIMTLFGEAFEDPSILRNRSITISTILLAWKRDVKSREAAANIAEFMKEFLCRLRWQVRKGLASDRQYHYLLTFQRHVTQASVEKPAVTARDTTLQEEYDRWRENREIGGDREYREETHTDPARACQEGV